MKKFKEYVDLRESNQNETQGVPYTKQVDEFCWRFLGHGGDSLAQRLETHQDRIVQDEGDYAVYRYGRTHMLYRVVETRPGIKIDLIWDETEG